MASNAVAATIAQARKLVQQGNAAPCSLASIATAAGYPRNKASSVRALARANGNGAQANGHGRYAHNTPAQWVALLTGAHAALAPQAPAKVVAKQGTANVRQGWLGKQAKAAKRGAKQAKAQGTPAKQAGTAQVTAPPTQQASTAQAGS